MTTAQKPPVLVTMEGIDVPVEIELPDLGSGP